MAVELVALQPPESREGVRIQSAQTTKITAAALLLHGNIVATHSLHISNPQPAAGAAVPGARAVRIVQEFCNAGSLQQAIDDGMFRPPTLPRPLPQIVAVLQDIAAGLAYAHARGVAHGQLTGDDILLKVWRLRPFQTRQEFCLKTHERGSAAIACRPLS